MEFFIYCRDKPGTARLRDELTEAHQSFMDGYAEAMIARGPTLTPDRMTATGSMHMVDLPDAEAARVFAAVDAFVAPQYSPQAYIETSKGTIQFELAVLDDREVAQVVGQHRERGVARAGERARQRPHRRTLRIAAGPPESWAALRSASCSRERRSCAATRTATTPTRCWRSRGRSSR